MQAGNTQTGSSAAGGSTTSFGYSPALDGLRACAVLAVVLFHCGVSGIGGGFLGVDTFFVLSGFLITSLLLAEQQRTGRIKLGRFWARRARRLLPALLAMLVATVITAHFLLDTSDLTMLRTDALAALGYAANWRMIWRGSGYQAATATASPLQHTWSLGIEEQFYLVWPLLIVGLLAVVAVRHRRTVLLLVCAGGTVASVAVAAYLYRPDSWSRSYFGTDTRAQALLIGAALAAMLTPAGITPTRRHAGRSRHVVLGLLALGAAVTTAWMWHDVGDGVPWMYHGGLTLAAAATAAIIAYVVVSPASAGARVLALPPLVYVGRISYGVYLWHWPIVVFVTSADTGLGRWPLLAVRLGLIGLVSVISFYVIEAPIRRGAWTRRWPKRVPIAITGAAVSAVIVSIVITTEPVTATTDTAAPVVVVTVSPSAAHASKSPGTPIPMERPGRKSGTSGTEPRVTFFGDSVSWVIGTYLPKHPGLWTSTRAIEGCGIATLPDILELGTPHTNYPGCTKWAARWQAGVNADDPDVAVIELNRWELMDRKLDGTYQHVGEPAYDAYLMTQLDHAVSIAGSHGAAVVLLTAAYTHRAEKPDGGLYSEDEPARVNAWNRLLHQEAAKHPTQVTVVDLTPIVCPHGTFTWTIGNLRVRSDGLHYTPEAVQRIIAPWLLPKLAAIATGTYKASTPR